MPNYLLAKLTYFTKCADQGLSVIFELFPTPFTLYWTSLLSLQDDLNPCLSVFPLERDGNTLQIVLTKVALAPVGHCAWANLLDDATYGLSTYSELLRWLLCTLLWARHHLRSSSCSAGYASQWTVWTALGFPALRCSSLSVSLLFLARALVLSTNLSWKYVFEGRS